MNDSVLGVELAGDAVKVLRVPLNAGGDPTRRGSTASCRHPENRLDTKDSCSQEMRAPTIPVRFTQVRGGQTHHGGNVSNGRPMDAAVVVDALTRAHRDLDRPQTVYPRASTGMVVVVGFNKRWGNFR